jgi:hypothetical protein
MFVVALAYIICNAHVRSNVWAQGQHFDATLFLMRLCTNAALSTPVIIIVIIIISILIIILIILIGL